MDRLTTSRSRLGFARILVQVNSDAALPEYIPITRPDGSIFKQPIIYENTLPKCSGCGFIGHNINQCRKKAVPPQQKKEQVAITLPHQEQSGDSSVEVEKLNQVPAVVTNQ